MQMLGSKILQRRKLMSVIPGSILACVDAEIDHCLFNKDQLQEGFRYEHKHSCNVLSKTPPSSFDGSELIAAIYDRIEKNLMHRPKRDPSAENWKLRPWNEQDAITANIKNKKNKSDEVTLERAIAKKWQEKWTYQMPIASGLFGSITDKRRAVDLVHSKETGHFDFVELKIQSDTPLYAAMEILGYGLVYLASRRDTAKNLKYNSENLPVLMASEITLCVLAPGNYYGSCSLEWLQDAINDGLKEFVKSDLKMDFRFEKFAKDFMWKHDMAPTDLTEEMLVRECVYPHVET
jgi:hypothetical protein